MKKSRQHWPAESIAVALTDNTEQEIALHGADISAQVMLAELYGSSACDAVCLWLAAEMKVPLVTFDKKLGLAAQSRLRQLE